MGLQSYEYGLRPQDSFEVIKEFQLTTEHLEILNSTPLIGPQSIGLYHFINQFVDDHHHYPLTHK